MAINSHIQVPNFILKNFAGETGKVCYLDLNTQRIGYAGTKTLGTEKGYYSDKTENELSSKIERPFSQLCLRAIDFVNQNTYRSGPFTLTTNEESSVKNYFAVSMARANATYTVMNNSSSRKDEFNDQEKREVLIDTATLLASDSCFFAKGYLVGIIINQSNRDFVIPRNCFYTFGEPPSNITMPISPKIAFGLFPEPFLRKHEYLRMYRTLFINNSDIINCLNIQALTYEYVYNGTFIASKNKAELEFLQQYYAEHLSDFARQKEVFEIY